jgi:hypothetical protein
MVEAAEKVICGGSDCRFSAFYASLRLLIDNGKDLESGNINLWQFCAHVLSIINEVKSFA